MLRIRYIGFAFMWFAATVIAAEPGQSLFTTSFLVHDQEVATRQAVVKQGLQRVLKKATGQSDIVLNGQIQSALEHPSDFTARFYYTQSHHSDTPWHLHWVYDEQAIVQLLERVNMKVWPLPRPAVVAWILVNDGQQAPYLVRASEGAAATIQQQAADVAIDWLIPFVDLTDAKLVTVADVRGRFLAPIRSASKRYDAGAYIVLAHATMQHGRWQGSWLIINQDQQITEFTIENNSLEALLSSGVARVVHTMAELVQPNVALLIADQLQVKVHGIKTMQHYLHAVNALRDMLGQVDYDIQDVADDRINLTLRRVNEPKQLVDVLSRHPQLELTTLWQPSDKTVEFQWIETP